MQTSTTEQKAKQAKEVRRATIYQGKHTEYIVPEKDKRLSQLAEKQKKLKSVLNAKSKLADSILGKKLYKRQSLLLQAEEVAGYIDEVIEMRNKNSINDLASHAQLASFDKIKILHSQDMPHQVRYKQHPTDLSKHDEK